MFRSDKLISFLLGALVGSAVGVLYAPEKGSDTRGKLSYQLKNYQKTLNNFIQDLSKSKLPNIAKERGDEVIKSAKDKAKELLSDVDSLLGEVQKG